MESIQMLLQQADLQARWHTTKTMRSSSYHHHIKPVTILYCSPCAVRLTQAREPAGPGEGDARRPGHPRRHLRPPPRRPPLRRARAGGVIASRSFLSIRDTAVVCQKLRTSSNLFGFPRRAGGAGQGLLEDEGGGLHTLRDGHVRAHGWRGPRTAPTRLTRALLHSQIVSMTCVFQ